ncbi:TonB-dependent receptor [Hankyongella ginsenosidimutans]|uniref:TonB-dependent receptor n=1 Tax=Hankyongella ginsenosidimutans TaxID=1763828 RepID=A0A4D7CBQ2_9SPHN|nr:TonB-dependent receptor [Hankyongella ginsenosidimutans]QCI79996.1 TonB-dependent receptor [Hankyongella ginsenosidimutans]
MEYSAPQRRTAVLETPTDGFTTVNLSALYRPFADDPRVSLNVAANNIADVTARRHASFLKDYAPLAGRDIRVNLRFEW